MDFATGALGTLLPKLGQLLQDEYNLHAGAKKNIQFLTRELRSIQAALRNIGEVPREQLDELVKVWACDARELSYDMEDIVDTFLVRVQGPDERPSKRSIKRFTKDMKGYVTKIMIQHDIGQDIKDVKERVKEIAERRDRYKFDTIVHAKTLVDPRIAALYTKETDLVGISTAMKEVIIMLIKEDGMPAQKQRIVSICGFGGLGKTTLAKAVYGKLKPQFNCMAFVPLSRNPNIDKFFKDMLYEFDKVHHKNIHNTTLCTNQLIDLVLEFLQNKRYLIVIDDIWDTESWKIIQCSLPESCMESIIIITTRNQDVAKQVGGCYKLKPLTPKSSKILFYGRIFGYEAKCPPQFSSVSEEILKKCGGVPLAIVTTSSLLADKLGNITDWRNVCDSIGSGLIRDSPSMEDMRKILLLSYYDLPSHLKTCLLYLSIFPEDYEIDRDRLIWRWIAEGFIQHAGEGDKSLFEIGQSYINELQNRSLIQPASMDDDDDMSPLSFRVHDMVLDVICSLSREENFATVVSGDCKKITSSSQSMVRRLSVNDTTMPEMKNMSKLRSLTISSHGIINLVRPLSCCYHLLRVLDLQDSNLKNHPNLEFVGKLFHLRFLSLARTGYAGDVPGDIGKLKFLQALDLSGTEIKELPSSIAGLRLLMSLVVEQDTRLPKELRNLSNLEVLVVLRVNSLCIAEELGYLTQLRILAVSLVRDKEGIWDKNMRKVLLESLGKLHKIQMLIVISDDVAADLEGPLDSLSNLSHLCICQTSRLPTWIDPTSFVFLSCLYIKVVQLRSEDLRVLGKLLALRYLKVGVATSIQVFERFTISSDAFPCLTRCRFYGFSSVPSIFPPGAMPRLEIFKFDIWLEGFRSGEISVDDLVFGHLPSLHAVCVRLCGGKQKVNQEAVMKLEEALGHQARMHPNHPAISVLTD